MNHSFVRLKRWPPTAGAVPFARLTHRPPSILPSLDPPVYWMSIHCASSPLLDISAFSLRNPHLLYSLLLVDHDHDHPSFIFSFGSVGNSYSLCVHYLWRAGGVPFWYGYDGSYLLLLPFDTIISTPFPSGLWIPVFLDFLPPASVCPNFAFDVLLLSRIAMKPKISFPSPVIFCLVFLRSHFYTLLPSPLLPCPILLYSVHLHLSIFLSPRLVVFLLMSHGTLSAVSRPLTLRLLQWKR